ncbi:ABC transporter substrate-binding protein [Halorarum salinum]|uniref:ABC transporter substrate-binding protein n=1 Tax=Halorarum salinum TaxID=2743089 RepID=A0A7D5LDR5_9EURY|nr:ABC transporter substrate-binding protein [Halobaculum salinum]
MLVATAVVLAGVVPAAAAGATAPTAGDGSAPADADASADGVQYRTDGDVPSCEFPFTATDATGTEVTVEERPERVTTLNPSAAQTMWEIGGEEQVVGVSQFALYLDGAETRENVSASGFGVSVERVVGTEPDLVLAPNSIPVETVEALRGSGLTVFHVTEQTNVTTVREKTTLIGQLTGNCEGAAEANAWMDANVEAAAEATADEEPVRALYPLGGGYVVNTGTFISTMLEVSGATNVVGEREFDGGYPQVNDEVIVELAPEYLVLTDSSAHTVEGEPYASTPAVENGNTVTVDANWMNQPAPRSVVYGVRNLTEGFHPDAAANAEFVARGDVTVESGDGTETASPTSDSTSEGETTADESEPTETSAAGFGAAVAALAVLTSALLARRS